MLSPEQGNAAPEQATPQPYHGILEPDHHSTKLEYTSVPQQAEQRSPKPEYITSLPNRSTRAIPTEKPKMVKALVRYLAVGRLAKDDGKFLEGHHSVIASYMSDNMDSHAKNYAEHVRQIMDKGSFKLKSGKRLRLTSDDDDYDLHVLSELLEGDPDKVLVYFVVTDPAFGQSHHIGRVFEDFKAQFLETNTVEKITRVSAGGSVHKASQQFMMELATKYGSSKLAEVNEKVTAVTGVMRENVSQALSNVENLEEMETHAEQFENQAQQFHKNSANLKKKMRLRYYKLNALLGFFVLAIVIYIMLQFTDIKGSDST